MINEQTIFDFLAGYDEAVHSLSLKLRHVLIENLPDIVEELDVPAKIIGYSYGKKYSELICVIIPSKKGVKLGFNRGNELPDPNNMLEGNGKISRYVVILSEEQINSTAIKELLSQALIAYKNRV